MRYRVNTRYGTYNSEVKNSDRLFIAYLKRCVCNATQKNVKEFGKENMKATMKYLSYKTKGSHIIDRFGQCVGYLDKQDGEKNRWFITILDSDDNFECVFSGTKKEALEYAKHLREVEKVGEWNEIKELKNMFYEIIE